MKTNVISSQQFNGLIGKNLYKDTYKIGNNNNVHYIIEEFYPFLDETSNEIDSFVKNRQRIISSGKFPTFNIIRKVVVRKALPFTKNEFNSYKKHIDTNDSNLYSKIETALKENDLYKYINEKIMNKNFSFDKFIVLVKKLFK